MKATPHTLMPRKMAIINFTGNRQNWGCQATSWELLKFLNGAFPAGYLPKLALILLLPRCDIDEQLQRIHLNDIYDAVFTVCSTTRQRGSALNFLERICRQRYGFWAEEVQTADFVVFQGEGTMTGTDFVRGMRLLLLPLVARYAWNKPVYSLNQTLFICDDTFATVVASVFNAFDFVAVRENISFDVAKKIGIDSVFHIPDTAFLTTPTFDSRLPRLSPNQYFALTGSAFPSSDVNKQIFELADAIRCRTGLKTVITASTQADRELERLAKKYWRRSTYEVVPQDIGYNAVTSILEQCVFLVGGRYHMTIMAASVGTPVVQVHGNTFKLEGLSAMLSWAFKVRPADDVTGALRDAQAILDNPDICRENLRHSVSAVLSSLATAQQWLAEYIRGTEPSSPVALRKVIGAPIDSDQYVEPYRSAAISQARRLKYPSASDEMRLGPRPMAGELLPPLLSALEGGDLRSHAAIRQVLASSSVVVGQLAPAVRHRLARAGYRT